MMWIPIFAAGVINGIGHFWGYRNYDSPDASTNILPWGILIGGEELHNNHHTYPTSAKLSSKGYEFDLGWLYIRTLSALRLAKILRVAPVPKVDAPRLRVDVQTLQAVINNRYDLLAKYARGLQSTMRDELEKLRLSSTDRARFGRLNRWLRKGDVARIPSAQQQTLRELLAHSRVMQTLVEMRAELAVTWEKSSVSREQMLTHLQDWIARAEASGIRVLQDAALRIRSYTVAPVSA
jgi:stearoyl-CoA desaturase (delta-9 desaturase)